MDAYLILCHDRPGQVNALARYLADDGNEVFIHADGGSMIHDRLHSSEHIHVLPSPITVRWGGWEITQATLRLMRTALADGQRYRYVHLLSGQCMPAMNRQQTEQVLNAAAETGTQFIECRRLPADERWHGRGGLYRMQVWYPRCMVSKEDASHRFFWWYTNKWLRLGVKRPGYFLFAPYYGGSQWWSLTGDAVKAVLEYDRTHPFMRYFFTHSFCSDEHYIHTCLAKTGYAVHATGDALRYIVWPSAEAASPRSLTAEDIPDIAASGCLFARKFALSEKESRDYLNRLES